jgi:SAM-dependent methyltransferase
MSMSRLKDVVASIRDVAAVAARLPEESAARQAREAVVCPIQYMRWAEFGAVLREWCPPPGCRVLDVGSPQWFTLGMARLRPDVTYEYVNIDPEEVLPYQAAAAAAGLSNVRHSVGDARALPFADAAFDVVLSLSVVEHVAPAEKGDALALAEFRRVLKPGGEVRLTMPFKDQGAIVRSADGGFYAREYDRASLDALIRGSGLTRRVMRYISERQGWLSPDYHEWGPGRGTPGADRYRRWRKQLEWRLRRPLDPWLAAWYLRVSDQPRPRVVNVVVVLGKDK